PRERARNARRGMDVTGWTPGENRRRGDRRWDGGGVRTAQAVRPTTLYSRYSPECTGSWAGGVAASVHEGRHSMTADQLGVWKNGIEMRSRSHFSGGGGRIWWWVETQRLLVQIAMRSPMFTT